MLSKIYKKLFFSGPYLNNPSRLADLLAAIQVLGTYEYASRDIDKWTKRLGRKPKSADSWQQVFDQHPEFFTTDNDEKIALVWRRSFKRDYDVTTKQTISKEELDIVKEDEKNNNEPSRLSRQPLDQAQIEHLCNLAINLHEREIQHRQETRWWLAGLVAIITALIAVIT